MFLLLRPNRETARSSDSAEREEAYLPRGASTLERLKLPSPLFRQSRPITTGAAIEHDCSTVCTVVVFKGGTRGGEIVVQDHEIPGIHYYD